MKQGAIASKSTKEIWCSPRKHSVQKKAEKEKKGNKEQRQQTENKYQEATFKSKYTNNHNKCK